MRLICIESLTIEINSIIVNYYFISGKIYKKSGDYLADEYNYPWQYNSELKQNFMTLSTYRKMKLKKINEKR